MVVAAITLGLLLECCVDTPEEDKMGLTDLETAAVCGGQESQRVESGMRRNLVSNGIV